MTVMHLLHVKVHQFGHTDFIELPIAPISNQFRWFSAVTEGRTIIVDLSFLIILVANVGKIFIFKLLVSSILWRSIDSYDAIQITCGH